MRQRLMILLIVALAGGIVALALFWHPQPNTARPGAGAPAGGDFVLTSADGPVDTATMRGKVLLVYFGYTYCPDICPTTLSTISQALARLPRETLPYVRVIFVSVDPERDTPKALKDYAAFFHPAVIGVTGSTEEVERAARLYGAAYARQNVDGAGYVVDHSSWTYVVAPDGRLAGRIPHGASVEQTLGEIRRHLPDIAPTKGNS